MQSARAVADDPNPFVIFDEFFEFVGQFFAFFKRYVEGLVAFDLHPVDAEVQTVFGEVGGLVQLFDNHLRIGALWFCMMKDGECVIDFRFGFAQIGEGDFFGLVVAFHFPCVAVQEKMKNIGITFGYFSLFVGIAQFQNGNTRDTSLYSKSVCTKATPPGSRSWRQF